MIQKFNRGDVYYYDFGISDGSVEGKRRPAVIVSNDKGNYYGTVVTICPITTRNESECKPWQVFFKNDGRCQVILTEQCRCVNVNKLENYCGKLDAITMKKLDVALATEFDLNTSDKELNSIEFITRLDKILTNVVRSTINKLEQHVLDNGVSSFNHEKIVSKLNSIGNENRTLYNEINEIKSLYNKNSDSLDKILTSLITIYKNINNSSVSNEDIIVKKDNENDDELTIVDTGSNSHVDIVTVVSDEEPKKSKKIMYTVEFAKKFMTDYYTMNKIEFMKMYEIYDSVQLNNKRTTIAAVLRRNGINPMMYKMMKKSNEIANKTTELKEIDPEIYKPVTRMGDTAVPGHNKGIKYKSKAEPFNYTVENCLAFINDWNTLSITDMCKKHDMNEKQIANRKYLICKWLLNRNVEFKIIDKRKKK